MSARRWLMGVALFAALAACSRPSFNRGVDAYSAKDYAGALAQWKPLAEAGDARAQSNLAKLYSDGLGVKVDPAEAARWMQKAAAQGDANAQANLGVLYMTGRGVAQDYAAARDMFAKAAAQDQAIAAMNLGVLYDNGQGGPADKAKAAQYYLQAANLGDGDAQLNAGVELATGEGVAADKIAAYKWFSLAAHAPGDGQRQSQAAANLARLKATMNPGEAAQGDAAIAAFRAKPAA